MHVALDLDDTITAHPEFFAFLAGALRAAGHRVTIMTLRCESGRATAEEDLVRFSVSWDELVMLPEGFDAAGQKLWAWKGERCRALKCDVLVDDMPEIANLVDEGTLVLVPRDPTLGHMTYMDPKGPAQT